MLVTHDTFNWFWKTMQDVFSSVTRHLNKFSEAFDMMHQTFVEMHAQGVGDLQVVIHDFDAKLKDHECKVLSRISRSQVANSFEWTEVAKELEQILLKLEKMNKSVF